MLGKKEVEWYIKPDFPDTYLEKVRPIISQSDKWISIFPGASEEVKRWPYENFAKVGDILSENGYSILLLGSIREKELLKKIYEKMEHKPVVPLFIDEEFGRNPAYGILFCMFSKLCISNESGGLHFAGLVNTPIVGIYGLKDPVKWGPLSQRSIALYKKIDCSPCKMRKAKTSCPFNRKCLLDISVDEVIEASKLSLGIK